jgi:hypothetical protein
VAVGEAAVAAVVAVAVAVPGPVKNLAQIRRRPERRALVVEVNGDSSNL